MTRTAMPVDSLKRPWWYRVGWLVLIWMCSVGALALVAGVLKLMMSMAGLTAKG